MRTDDRGFLRLVLGLLGTMALSQFAAGCSAEPLSALGLSIPSLPALDLQPLVLVGPSPRSSAAKITERPDERSGWCEPLVQQPCSTSSGCPADHTCVHPWWAEDKPPTDGDPFRVCAHRWPTRADRRWRADRLRVYVDHVCSRSRGCEPNDLHAYLRLLALRESTWQPYDRHRLNPDLEASASAWARHRAEYAGNPAASDPDRWSTGLGLYGQIPALWLRRWDPLAPPETLCGEVEASEVHLRAARDQVQAIAGGVDCDRDGRREFFGTACSSAGCRPSWYDVSRTNSGRLCPGSAEHRDAFAARARRVGLDPLAPVGLRDLGEALPLEQQDEIAASLRARMDALPRP